MTWSAAQESHSRDGCCEAAHRWLVTLPLPCTPKGADRVQSVSGPPEQWFWTKGQSYQNFSRGPEEVGGRQEWFVKLLSNLMCWVCCPRYNVCKLFWPTKSHPEMKSLKPPSLTKIYVVVAPEMGAYELCSCVTWPSYCLLWLSLSSLKCPQLLC